MYYNFDSAIDSSLTPSKSENEKGMNSFIIIIIHIYS